MVPLNLSTRTSVCGYYAVVFSLDVRVHHFARFLDKGRQEVTTSIGKDGSGCTVLCHDHIN